MGCGCFPTGRSS
jgi:V8-like Glu-specific endopeptidase